MKKSIIIRKIELKNFKNHISFVTELPPGGMVVAGFNGSGKSSILEAVYFALGGSVEASKVINQTTKAAASVSITIEHPDGLDTYTRVLTPTLDASGKVTSSTSTYSINGQPEKAFTFNAKISKLFNTKDWNTMLRPEAIALHKDARPILLAVAGAPEERAFLAESNPQLANIIGGMSFNEFETKEKHSIEQLGKKITTEIPAKIEELSSMLQNVPELEDEAPIHARFEEIRKILKGVDAENSLRADEYNKVACQAQNMRIEAQKLRNMAAASVAQANKEANKQADEADAIISDWHRTASGLKRQADQINTDLNQARADLVAEEEKASKLFDEMNQLAQKYHAASSATIESDKLGQCQACNKWCADLAAKGVEAAEKQRSEECARIIQKGKEARAKRETHLKATSELAEKVGTLLAAKSSIEAKINALGEAPTAPERKVITETLESVQLIKQAEDMDATARELIKGNVMAVTQKPSELVEELQALNEKLTGNSHNRQARKNNDKINARINELREETSILTTQQLQHKQHVIQLKAFYKAYADSVTASVNKLFDGTDYEIRLFETNMSNDKGVPVLQPMKNGSTNLSTAENMIFWIQYVNRVLYKHYDIKQCPMLLDNAECVSKWGFKLVGKHQPIISVVEDSPLTIFKLDGQPK